MSKYFMIYLALLFFATSLAVAEAQGHGSEATESTSGREPAAEGSSELIREIDNSFATPMLKLLDDAEKGLGKKRNTGEFVEAEER